MEYQVADNDNQYEEKDLNYIKKHYFISQHKIKFFLYTVCLLNPNNSLGITAMLRKKLSIFGIESIMWAMINSLSSEGCPNQ